MQVATTNNGFAVIGNGYRIAYDKRDPLFVLVTGRHFRQRIFLLSTCDHPDRLEYFQSASPVARKTANNAHGCAIHLSTDSNLWNKKDIVLQCGEDYLE
jgi:hypothetical protein